jgi:hypothetical protein
MAGFLRSEAQTQLCGKSALLGRGHLEVTSVVSSPGTSGEDVWENLFLAAYRLDISLGFWSLGSLQLTTYNMGTSLLPAARERASEQDGHCGHK